MSDRWLERLGDLDDAALTAHLCRQGWFRCDRADLAGADVVAVQPVGAGEPPLLSVVVEARHRSGLSDLYQLVVVVEEHGGGDLAARDGSWGLRDALADPDACRALVARCLRADRADGDVALSGSEKGSSSVRVGPLVLKVYRVLQAGPNVELEWLEVLDRAHFAHVPKLRGRLALASSRLTTTLGIVQDHVGDAVAGPAHLRELADDADALQAAAAELGAVIAALHEVEGAPGAPFAPAAPSSEGAAMLLASVEDEVDAALQALPPDADGEDHGAAAAIRGRLHALSGGALGSFVRTHGDLRLRHAFHSEAGWMLVGFQGDLDLPAAERRRKRPGLWDVACARTSIRRVGEDHGGDRERWEHAAAALAQAYSSAVGSGLLPPSRDVADALLTALELQRAAQLVRRTAGDPEDQRRWVAALRDLVTDARTPR